MRINIQIACLALVAGLHVGCNSIPADNQVGSGIVAGPLTVTEPMPIEKIVAALVETCRTNGLPIVVEFVVRDRQVGANPRDIQVAEADVPPSLEWGSNTFQCKSVRLEIALACVLDPMLDFSISRRHIDGPVRVKVGPPELVKNHPSVTRRTYLIPREHVGVFSGLPDVLPASGIGVAFSPERRELTVIDNESESVVGEILQHIDAEGLDLQSPEM